MWKRNNAVNATMRVSPVFVALQSAGICAFVHSALAEQTGEYVFSEPAPAANDMNGQDTYTHVLTDRRLSPLTYYTSTRRRVYPWQASFYDYTPRLRGYSGNSPMVYAGQHPLMTPYVRAIAGEWEVGSDVSASQRAAAEASQFSHFRQLHPIRPRAIYGENLRVPQLWQTHRVSADTDDMLAVPLIYRPRLLSKEETGNTEAEGKESNIYEGRAKSGGEGADHYEKRSKLTSKTDEKGAGEKATADEIKARQAKKQDAKIKGDDDEGDHRHVGKAEAGGGKADEEGTGDKYPWDLFDRPGGSEGDSKESRAGAPGAGPSSSALLEKQKDRGAGGSAPSSGGEGSLHDSAGKGEESDALRVQEKRHAVRPSGCVGVCKVRISRTSAAERDHADAGVTHEMYDSESSSSDRRDAGKEAEAGALSRERRRSGEESTHGSDAGHEAAEMRPTRAPEGTRRRLTAAEYLMNYPESVNWMEDPTRRLFKKYHNYPEYHHVTMQYLPWLLDYPGIYWGPEPTYYNYYGPWGYHSRWLKEVPSTTDRDVDGGSDASDRGASGVMPQVYSEGMEGAARRLFKKYHKYPSDYYSAVQYLPWFLDYPGAYWGPRTAYYDYYRPWGYHSRWLKAVPSATERDVDGGSDAPDRRASNLIPQVYSEGIKRMAVDCAPGSSCSKLLLDTYPHAQFSDDIRQLEHQHGALGPHHLGTDRKYPYVNVYQSSQAEQ